MKLAVYIRNREIAALESVGDFESMMTYLPAAGENDFVSLTMPVRTESYQWPDQLHPVFQMNLPEGYLLQVLQEEFGPHIGSSPATMLSVIGRNMVGRLQVTVPGANLQALPQPIEVADLLQGDNSEEAFASLVRQHATSGVSGVLPKFLDMNEEAATDNPPAEDRLGTHPKATLFTRRHIIKGSSGRLPFAALNEYLCMQVVQRILPSATTRVSDDGKALVVDRFDVDEHGQPLWGMEDFCSLLGLRPAQKYETTWERIATAVIDHVPGRVRYETFQKLAQTLLLTYALRNADCHAKNLALLYTTWDDVHLSPAYDFLTTNVYAGYDRNPPGISFMGRKTWNPGKTLPTFISSVLQISLKEQSQMVEAIGDAISEVLPLVERKMTEHPEFQDLGKRILLAWHVGLHGLRGGKVYARGAWPGDEAFEKISAPPKLKSKTSNRIGRSPLLGRRGQDPTT